MSGTRKNHRFLFSPYIFSLAVFLMVAALGVSTWLIIAAPVAGDRGVFIAFVLGVALLILVPLVCSRECFGWYTIDGNSITLHAPFRRPLSLRYENVRCVGIGRSYAEDMTRRNDRFIYTPANNFWLFLSCDPVPATHLNDMSKFRQSSRGLRIAYSRKAFAALMDCLPPDLAKQLDRSRTTLRAWGVKDA